MKATIEETRRAPVVWNSTASDCRRDYCAHQLFEAQVERTPNAVAIIYQQHCLTYQEINSRANRLARYLQDQGAGPESLIGIAIPRSPEMIVALLAVLKAGAAYVPFDPSYPTERLEYMLEDAAISLLLASQPFIGEFPNHRASLVDLAATWPMIARHSAANLNREVSPDNLAYMIYTSGSTGRPKGVLIPHRGLCNMAQAQARAFGVDAGSRVLQFASLNFDASVSEIFKTLTVGASLYLEPHESRLTGASLSRVLKDEQITVVTLPPSILATLAADEFPQLSALIVAGEACPVELINRWSAGRRFFNAYGPTEATVCATIAECQTEAKHAPIGYPLAGASVDLLDSDYQPVQAGEAGELFIGGVGVGRGYRHRADLTAERFVPDLYSGEAGQRAYRTGDLGRYLFDGQIAFIGRLDHQVKVRGYRIEPGEIESVLSCHPLIEQCVVAAKKDRGGEPQLIGYVVASRASHGLSAELKDFLRRELPEFMIPSAFVAMSEFPLTANGKVDRAALPSAGVGRPDLQAAYEAPRNPIEGLLARLWQEVLGIENIGIHDSFFELGGESIKAARFLNRLQEEFGEVVYVVALFDAPTIARLASYLEVHYREAVARVGGGSYLPAEKASRRINDDDVAQFRGLIKPLPPLPGSAALEATKNPPAVFILSPPRSGSTLLRVMLAGHRRLFAPPELQLLSFNTLADRKATFTGRYSFWLEGTIRALMEIKGCAADEARAITEQGEAQQMPTKQFYALMQEWLGERLLVDKTPAYALDLEAIRRAEDYFDNPLYIHLIRHPNGMIRSFQDAKLDQIFRYEHSYSVRELAELIWTVCHQNIAEFLHAVPQERQHRIYFEDLVSRPQEVMQGLCNFLGLDFDAAMVQPHKDKENRMTDGIHGLSRMLGDIKFHTHDKIDAKVADRWKEGQREDLLGDVTWRAAESLGYERPAVAETAAEQNAQPIRQPLTPLVALPRKAKSKNLA